MSPSPFQSALHPAGEVAGHIANLWWVMLAVCTVVYVIVVSAAALAAFRRRRGAAPSGEGSDANGERRLNRVVWGGVVATALVLVGLLFVSESTGRAVTSISSKDALTIEVVGRQWWWEVTYPGAQPADQVTTANEIHVPVGRAVAVALTSHDVIHSFWPPNLAGKTDLIPGYWRTAWLRADRPGVYRGQCAEFCGFQHARMAFHVVAEPPEKFESWLAAQREPAAEPTDALQERGRAVFLSGPCVLCHRILGTGAFATAGPDLTHVGSRLTLAAGTLPNVTGHMAGWIVDSQSIKPGNAMPPNVLAPRDLDALLAYLRNLK